MPPLKREDVTTLLQSTWSAFASRSRRAAAGATELWTAVNGPTSSSIEYLNLMPGWAVKRRLFTSKRRSPQGEINPFDLHVSISGFAVAMRDFKAASATQRAVVNVAKRFAALPRLAATGDVDMLSRDSDDHIRPNGVSQAAIGVVNDDSAVALAHRNLDTRLSPFWSRALTNRRLVVSLYTITTTSDIDAVTQSPAGPLFETVTDTDDQGLFSQHIVVPWERLCNHPPSIPLACADTREFGSSDFQLLLQARLQDESGGSVQLALRQGEAPDRDGENFAAHAQGASSNLARGAISCVDHIAEETRIAVNSSSSPSPQSRSIMTVSEPKGVRVISDLDDTIKHSDILAGPREVFRNVFCRPLQDLCVPGMDKLYREMTSAGVDGFHMISNSPFELYNTIKDFMTIHRFPVMYSLKLKYYGRRSLLGSLMEPAGERKKPAIVEVLEAFPESCFVLFGDSGEQDLEVYSGLARDRPHQIRGVFIRDITSERADAISLFDRSSREMTLTPSYSELDLAGLASPSSEGRRTPTRQDSGLSERSSASSIDTDMSNEIRSLTAAQQKILRRAALWDVRMEKARQMMPKDVPLVFFTDARSVQETVLPLVQSLLAAASEAT